MCIKKRASFKGRDNYRIVTREEEAKIVNLLRENSKSGYYSDVADLIEVLIDTGMRKLEAIELRYKDVNFESNMITVQTTMGDLNRHIPMTRRVADILKRRQSVDHHKPFNLNDMQIHMAWTWVGNQMGLRNDNGFVLYALRMTCTSRLINAGVDHYRIKEWLGHSHSNKMLTERYAQLALHQSAHDVEMIEE